MTTLLEKASKIPTHRKKSKRVITPQHIELAIAWAKDEIRLSQIMAAMEMGGSTTTVYTFLALVLRQAMKDGLLVEGKPKK
jgi:hypothetical protein